MGLQEELSKSLDVPGVSKGTRIDGKPSVKRSDDGKLVHMHPPSGRCAVRVDEDGRRRPVELPPRLPPYAFNCKACVEEDFAYRESGRVPDDQLENTVFLIPEDNFPGQLAKLYLDKKYPTAIAMREIKPERLASWPSAQVVVVTRRVARGKARLGLQSELRENKKDEMVEVPIPIETHIDEIFESKPVVVADCIQSTIATMFTNADLDISEFQERLGDVAAPYFYIASYQRVVGNPELTFCMRRF